MAGLSSAELATLLREGDVHSVTVEQPQIKTGLETWFLLGAAGSTAIPVVMLTWVGMPRLTRLLDGWLYSGGAAAS